MKADIIWFFVYFLSSGSCEWNIETDKCNGISSSDLIPLQECKVSFDKHKYLHAICEMYCYLESGFSTSSDSISAVLVTWGLKSKEPVLSFNNTICLWMANVTIEKLVNPRSRSMLNTKFYLSMDWKFLLWRFEEGCLEFVFYSLGRMVAIANVQGSCNSISDFSSTYGQTSMCKLRISAIEDMVLSSKWLISMNSSLSNIYENIYRIRSVYLIKEAHMSLFRTKLYNFIVNQKIFICVLKRFNISWIEMSQTNFNDITETDFQGFFNLKSLNLTEGVIETIAPNALHDLRNLEVIDFSYNKLEKIPDAIFVDSLKKLVNLTLEGNVPPGKAFTLNLNGNQTSPLLALRLSRNLIQKLNGSSFSSFPLLEELYLDWCDLTYVSNRAFENLTFLAILDMTGNNIDLLPENIFQPLHSLQYLNLNLNKLGVFSSSLVDSLPSLNVLNLENNNLTELFIIPPNLSVLNLRSNYIKTWNSFNISQLQHLDLSSNAISTLTEKNLAALEKIKKVNLSRNPFNCSSCPLHHLQLWLKKSNVEDIDHYLCQSPFDLVGAVALYLPSTSNACLVRQTNVGILSTPIIGTISIICVLSSMAILVSIAYYFRWHIRYFIFQLKSLLEQHKADKTSPVYDAFVSYAKSERPWVVNELVRNLETEGTGLRFCIHDRDFMPGSVITTNIIECIDQSRKVILVLSETYVESQWCTLEAHLAQHRLFEKGKDSLIIVKMGQIPPKSLKRYFSHLINTRTCLEWPSTEEAKQLFWNKLSHYLCKASE